MPFRKVSLASQMTAREASSRRSSHSPLRQSAMGNRQLVPSAPPGRGRTSSLTRATKKNGLTLNKPVGDAGFQRKPSSGPATTVGSMIPFQRASRREPHVQPQANEGDRNVLNKMTVPKKNPSDIAQKQPANENNDPNGTNEKGISSTSDTKPLPLPNINQKAQPGYAPGGKSQTRSVRPKLKRPSIPKEQINIASSQKTSNPTGARNTLTSAKDKRPTEQEVVSVSTTSPRRRIVKRKLQTLAAERKSDSNEVHLSSSIQENERSHPQGTNDVPLSSSGVTTNGDGLKDMSASSHIVGTSLDTSRPMSRSRVQHLNQSLPEYLLRTELTLGNGAARQNSNEESEHNARGNSEISAALHPRPPPSARMPLTTSSSRNRDNQNRFETGRPTIQPARAVATDLHESSSALVTEGQEERHPNSVRRSLDRLGTGYDRSSSERPSLARQNVSGLTSRARQREVIDVNSAVSELTTRVPQSSRTPSGPVRTPSRIDATPSRVEHDTASTEEDVWVPRIQPNGRNSVSSIHELAQNSSTHSPISPEPSGSPRGGRSDTPDVVFRDSPVTGLLHRRHSRLSTSSDNETYPSVRNTTRNAPTIPSRRGLYRALSVNDETTDSNDSEINRTNLTTQNHRDTRTYNRIENIDDDDVVSWRQIESEHSYPSREPPRQRLIYQDRNRGRETILNRNRIVPPSMDSVPDIADDQEFPPLGGSSSSRRFVDGTTQVQASSRSGQDYGITSRTRRVETPPPTPTPGSNPIGERSSEEDDPMPMVDSLVLLASPIFGPLMLQASPAVLFNMLSRARRDFGGEFVELLIENVVLSLLAQHTFDATNQTQNNNGAPPPATQETIDSLEKVTVTKQMVSEDAFCSICHCEYMTEEILDQLPCKHNFHNQCITVWLEKSGTCPVCRHKLYTESVE